MAKTSKAEEFQNEPHIFVESWFNRPMTKAFAESSEKFLDRLQFLRQKLERQFERYSDDGGLTSRQRWNPPEYFNACHFRSQLRPTYEAWSVARRLNHELDAFDGTTVLTLVRLFEELSSGQRANSGAPAPADLCEHCFKFEYEVNRFELLLSLKNKTHLPERPAVEKIRRNAARDSQWYEWRQAGMTDAQIRDRWDSENPANPVSRNNIENGLGIVASAIRREENRKTQGTG